jgi:hypothetical protein
VFKEFVFDLMLFVDNISPKNAHLIFFPNVICLYHISHVHKIFFVFTAFSSSSFFLFFWGGDLHILFSGIFKL